MFKVGLTGGIGCGKSTVAALFAQLGIPVIDADETARALVTPGSEALNEIIRRFGDHLLNRNGTLDRAALRREIFTDESKRRDLESILHPRIIQHMHAAAADAPGPYCILVMPLLLEAGQQDAVDRILVVDCDQDLQRQRATSRDSMSDTQFDQVLAAQVSREQRLAAADDVVVNDADLQHLKSQVQRLHTHYLQQAGA